MGTAEQKARRAQYAKDVQAAWDAGQSGQWRNDAELRSYLNSIGIKGNPIYNQLYSGGGYNLYGPNWQPGWNYDFEAGQKIPYMGEGETWYDPSNAENWQNMGPIERRRMDSWFNWRDSIQEAADRENAGNTLAYWFSRHPANTPQSNILDPGAGYNSPPPNSPPPRPPRTGFWNWFYGEPQDRLRSLMGSADNPSDFPNVDFTPLQNDQTPDSLFDTPGFDRARWDAAFNTSTPTAAGDRSPTFQPPLDINNARPRTSRPAPNRMPAAPVNPNALPRASSLATSPTIPITASYSSIGGSGEPTTQIQRPTTQRESITPFNPLPQAATQAPRTNALPRKKLYRSIGGFGQGSSWNPRV